MSLFGKILAVLNVVAAIAFVYFATTDYAKRQAWAQSAFRHELQITGLPVDDKVVDVDGVPIVENMTPATLQQVFTGIGQPVKTQREEVNRVRTQLQAKADDPNIQGTKAEKLARILLPLAQTGPHREELIRLMTKDPRAQLTEQNLVDEFNRLFDGATRAGGSEMPPDGQRDGIAALLVPLCVFDGEGLPQDINADPVESPGYKRAVVVIGLEEAARAVKARAFALQQVAQDIAQSAEYDRANFVATNQKVLMELQTLLKELEAAKYADGVQQGLVQKHQLVVDKRKNDVTEMENQLKEAIAKTQAVLKDQAAVEAALFKKQQEKKAAQEKNNALEKEIEKLEQGR
jgi:hypothetical protein